MSLMPTYVLADDGNFYKDPILCDSSFNWFVCFHDYEPPEFIVRRSYSEDVQEILEFAQRILRASGIRYKSNTIAPTLSLRHFPPKWKSFKACSFYLEITKPIPKLMIWNPSNPIPPANLICRVENRCTYMFGASYAM